MYLLPQQIKKAKFVVLYLADRAVRLPNFQIGDLEEHETRHTVWSDLLAHQAQRPIAQRLVCTTNSVLRRSTNPNAQAAVELQTLVRKYPGHVAKVVMPDRTTYNGIISNLSFSETRSVSDCAYNISFELTLLKVIRAGGTPVYY